MNDTVAKLAFDFEWIDPEEAKGPELRATWARLRVSVDGQSVTRVVDGASRSVRDSVFLPLYPLAEWLVSHWWSLLYEVETPRRTAEEYIARHSIHTAREGFALPALSIVPLGNLVRVDWAPAHLSSQRVEFTERGSEYLPTNEFRQVATDFVAAVAGRLREYGVEDTVLQADFEAVVGADDEEEQFCAAAAALGLDPYSIEDTQSEQILGISKRIPQNLIQEFFAVANVGHLEDHANRLVAALDASRTRATHLDELRNVKAKVHHRLDGRAAPWEQGYQLARVLRQHLDLNGTIGSSIQTLGDALGVGSPLWMTVGVPDLVDAVVDIDGKGSPGFGVGKKNERADVFTFCRALSEYLTTSENEPLIVTRARSEHQKRSRAFAAEFLVPSELLRQRLQSDLLSDEDVDDLASEFSVSPWVVRHQLENHDLAKILA